jgi:hypothetical protein
MTLQTAQLILEWVRNLILVFGVVLGVQVTIKLFEKQTTEKMMDIKKIVFLLLTIAFAFMALGFITENISGVVNHDFSLFGAICFSLAYICCIIAFSYFWHQSSRFHKLHLSEPIFFIGVVAAVMLWDYYLMRLSIGIILTTPSLLNKLIFLIHPLAVSLIFLLTLIIHPTHQAKVIRTPIWYLSGGVFFYFIAYMMLTYSFLKPTGKVLPFVYSILFIISSAYFAIGFYAAKKKYADDVKKETAGPEAVQLNESSQEKTVKAQP